MTMRAIVYALYLMLAAAKPVFADAADNCNQSHDANLRVIGCSALIENGEDLSAAYNNRGIGYADMGQIELAIADYTTAISVDPNNTFPYINRGFAYTRLPNFFLAMDDFNHVIAVSPGTPIAYLGRGIASLERGEWGSVAIPDFNKAIELLPTFVEAYYQRGNAYRQMREFARAVADYDQALAIDPDAQYVRYHRAYCHCKLGHMADAMADFEASWAYDPGDIVTVQSWIHGQGYFDRRANGVADDATRSALKLWIADACPP